jgi:hypothetical protein
MLEEFPGWGIVAFRAVIIRGFGKGISPDANDDDGEAHAIIEDLTGGEGKRLAKACEWFVLPSGYQPKP